MIPIRGILLVNREVTREKQICEKWILHFQIFNENKMYQTHNDEMLIFKISPVVVNENSGGKNQVIVFCKITLPL